MFSYVSPEQRVPADHPLRLVRQMVDGILPRWGPSIAPERVLRALLLQIFYRIRSNRLLMEQLDYNVLFR
jgi:transposase